MKKNVFLHIGMGKAGSTTIQTFLLDNRDILAERGFFFPATPGLPHHFRIAAYATVGGKGHRLLHRVGVFNETQADEFGNKFFRDFNKEISNTALPNIILSSEFCFSLQKNEIQKLASLLEPFAGNVKIIVYVRRQDDWWVSRYGQMIKMGKTTKRYEPPNAKDATRVLNYYQIISRWKDVFGADNITVRPFEKEQLLQGDPAIDFLSILGLEYNDKFSPPKHKNKSLSHAALEMVRKINLVIDELNLNDAKDIKQRLGIAAQEISDGPPFTISTVAKSELIKQFEDENKKLASEFLSRRDGRLFYRDLDELTDGGSQDVDSTLDVKFSAKLWLWACMRIMELEAKIKSGKSR